MARTPHYVVLGNGIAGTTAAERLRRAEPDAQVTLLTEEPHPLYNRIKLPFLLAGLVSEPAVFIREAADHARAGIDFRAGVRVTAVATKERAVVTDTGAEIPFTKLLIATGGRPLLLDGARTAGRLHSCHSLADTGELMEAMKGGNRSALVVGGSLAGADVAAALALRGVETTWLVRGPYLFHRELDAEGGAIAHEHARRAGVTVCYNAAPAGVLTGDGVATGLRTQSGDVFTADIVACGIGLTRNTEFLTGSGIAVKRGIVTDEYLETSVPGIFAAGDVAEFPDSFLGDLNLMGTWHSAVEQGDLAARNMSGDRRPFLKMPFYNNALFASRIRLEGRTARHDQGLDTVTRANHQHRHYCRLFLDAGKLVGAAVIGAMTFEARRALSGAIKEQVSRQPAVRLVDELFSNGLRR